MAIETLKYKVLKIDGKIELREYPAHIIATTEVTSSDYNNATNQGFSLIADYIFGNNLKRDKVAMTSPVIQENADASEKIAMTTPVNVSTDKNQYKISFVMPSKYSLENLPIPNNKSVELKKIASFRAAVLRFSGFVNKDSINQKTKSLTSWIKANNLQATGALQVARFDPPWTPWFLRHNEIIIQVK
jgi:DNA gyrase inhibitor GyrI